MDQIRETGHLWPALVFCTTGHEGTPTVAVILSPGLRQLAGRPKVVSKRGSQALTEEVTHILQE